MENVEVKEYNEDDEPEIEESDKREEQVEKRGETKIYEYDENHKKKNAQKDAPPHAPAGKGDNTGADPSFPVSASVAPGFERVLAILSAILNDVDGRRRGRFRARSSSRDDLAAAPRSQGSRCRDRAHRGGTWPTAS